MGIVSQRHKDRQFSLLTWKVKQTAKGMNTNLNQCTCIGNININNADYVAEYATLQPHRLGKINRTTQSIGVKIAFDAVYTAYLMWVIGHSTQFDAIAMSIWSVAFNMVPPLGLQDTNYSPATLVKRQLINLFICFYPLLHTNFTAIIMIINQFMSVFQLACLPTLFVVFMGVLFWTLHTGSLVVLVHLGGHSTLLRWVCSQFNPPLV